jgi:uncharacterized membrane protein YgdD (TMEM256/DUF423 family)
MTDAGTMRWPGVAASVAGASAVILGALGAHALHAKLPPQMLDVWHVAVQFQFWHALALLACALMRRTHATHLAAALFAFGIVLFCGSLYALALGDRGGGLARQLLVKDRAGQRIDRLEARTEIVLERPDPAHPFAQLAVTLRQMRGGGIDIETTRNPQRLHAFISLVHARTPRPA